MHQADWIAGKLCNQFGMSDCNNVMKLGYDAGHNQWPAWQSTLLSNANIPISNIKVENAIRPFVLGRKAWLFMGSPRGASASAVFYTLIETAKSNGLEPYYYLRYVFEKLPTAKTDEDLTALLPTDIDLDTILNFFRPPDTS